MRKSLLALLSVLVVTSMLIAACGGGAPAPAAPAAEATTEAAVEATTEAAAEATTEAAAEATTEAATEEATTEAAAEATAAATETPVVLVAPAEVMEGRIPVRWFVGLGTGTDPAQIPVEQKVVEDFNKSQDKIQLILEVVTYNAARDTLATEIASGNGPDIVGPVGWGGSNAFYGQWLDLAPVIKSSGYDTSKFSDELIKFYQTEEGQVGLPFAVFPAGTYFQKEMFDEAGLNYPPTEYGKPYVLPGGKEVIWDWDTLTNIAKVLTVDENGNSPLELNDQDEFVANPDFDKTKIVQYGYVPQYQDPFHIAAFVGGAAKDWEEVDGKAVSKLPDSWKAAWKWYYDGMYGDQPFIPNDAVVQSPEFGAGNAFNGGKVAMAVTQMWYTCCIGDAGKNWELGVVPSNADGKVNSRVDADTFRILKDTKNPEAAFEVLSYLIGPASLELLNVYGGMPAVAADQDSFFKAKAEQYPFVQNWDSIKAGLAYPDNPSAEGYRPSWTEVFNRYVTFRSLMGTTPGLDMDKEIETLQSDFQAIFDKAAAQ